MTIDNRGEATLANDTWLTPPGLLTALGPFDIDPCCPLNMPWRTASKMISLPTDGLAVAWTGLAWVNPPYSQPLPWIERCYLHGNAILLLPAKSPETRWGQRLLLTADLLLYQKGRMLFHYLDGTCSTGKWSPYVLAAYGPTARAKLIILSQHPLYGGVLLERPTSKN